MIISYGVCPRCSRCSRPQPSCGITRHRRTGFRQKNKSYKVSIGDFTWYIY